MHVVPDLAPTSASGGGAKDAAVVGRGIVAELASVVSGVTEMIARRMDGDNVVDAWGADDDIIDLIIPMTTLRLAVRVERPGALPLYGPCVIVANRRFGISEPFVVLRAVRQATGRRARFLGIPDLPVVATVMRRLGGAVDRPDELAGLLRAGNVVMEYLEPRFERGQAGMLLPEKLQAALDLDVPVVPMALIGGEITGRWTVRIGDPVVRPAGRTPFSLSLLADAAQSGVQALLR